MFMMRTYTSNHLGRLAKVGASLHGIGLGKVVLNEPQPNIVAHLVELLIDLDIVALVIFAELCDDGSVC